MHIVCPNCSSINRVPENKLKDQPHCGKCKRLLFQAKPLEVDADGLKRHITKNDLPVLVDFWAPWCGPCRMMAPAFAQVAQRMEPYIRLLKLNTEDYPQIANQYGIRGIPTLILFHRGRELNRLSGALNTNQLMQWIQSQIGR